LAAAEAAAAAEAEAAFLAANPGKKVKKAKVKELTAQEKAAEAIQELLNSGTQHPFAYEPTRVINKKGDIKMNITILMSTVLKKGRVGKADGAGLSVRFPKLPSHRTEFLPFSTGMRVWCAGLIRVGVST